jgi:hypothetical protein
MLHFVQIVNQSVRKVAIVEEPYLRCLAGVTSIYELAKESLRNSVTIPVYVRSVPVGESLLYDDVYSGKSPWKLLSPIDVPGAPSHLLVAGTGLTHIGSAKERQEMHLADPSKKAEIATDSMRMFQWGIEGGRPPEGQIGVAPEWFYKGDGSVLRAPFEPIEIPGYAEDGGEEAELAGVYIIADDGTPCRIGIAIGNEFSDHKFEKRNYLNLAGSKLRACSLGPELVVGANFTDVHGEVRLKRSGQTFWHREIVSGEENMCHSLANMEHHHFKFAGHRQPGDVHVHFFGANALSFAQNIALREGDVMEIRFDGFGRALSNPIHEEARLLQPVRVRPLA